MDFIKAPAGVLDATQRIMAAIDALTVNVTGSHQGTLRFSVLRATVLTERLRLTQFGELLIGAALLGCRG